MVAEFVEDGFSAGARLHIRLAATDGSHGQISQRISGQLTSIIDHSDLSPGDKKDCKITLEVIAAKLVSMCYLRDSYGAVEDRLIAEAEKEPAQPGTFVDVFGWDELYRDFDLFAVQVKSVLDHMTFFLRYVNGRKMVGFRAKGVAIINSLSDRQMGKNGSAIAKKTAKRIIKTIEDNDSWLKATIDARDDFNHFLKQGKGAVHPKRFVVLAMAKPAGVQIVRPMNDGKAVREIINQLFDNMILFVECFIALCLCPSVTKVGIVCDRPGKMDQTMFSFMTWAAIDTKLANGSNAEGVLNERNSDPGTWVIRFPDIP